MAHPNNPNLYNKPAFLFNRDHNLFFKLAYLWGRPNIVMQVLREQGINESFPESERVATNPPYVNTVYNAVTAQEDLNSTLGGTPQDPD